VKIVKFCWTIALVVTTLSQLGFPQSKEASVRAALKEFSEALTSGHDVQPYFADPTKKEFRELVNKHFEKFEFVGLASAEVQFKDETHATVPIRVRWETLNQSAMRTTAVQLVKSGDQWKIENPDFWEVHFSLLFLSLLGYSFLYGLGTCWMYWNVTHREWPSSKRRFWWEFLSAIPGTLPIYLQRKPWQIKPVA
jgi:hypothetical protein